MMPVLKDDRSKPYVPLQNIYEPELWREPYRHPRTYTVPWQVYESYLKTYAECGRNRILRGRNRDRERNVHNDLAGALFPEAQLLPVCFLRWVMNMYI